MPVSVRLDPRYWNPLWAASRLHVLLLDDSPGSRAETRRLLSQGGIIKVSDGIVSGRDFSPRACDPTTVDVILSEMELRGGWGMDVLKTIRLGHSRDMRPDVCFIFLTSETKQELISAASHLDANGYLTKPIAPDRLQMAILRGLARNCLVDFDKYRDVQIGDLAPPLVH